MRIAPRSLQEIYASKPLPKGIYEALITGAQTAYSRAGREMIVLDLEIASGQGRIVRIKDFLTEGTPAEKLRHLCEIAGCTNDYERGELRAEAFVGVRGRCRLVIVRDREGVYPDRNAISDYLTGPFAVPPKGDAA